MRAAISSVDGASYDWIFVVRERNRAERNADSIRPVASRAPAAVAAALVGVAAIVLWLAYDVRLGEIALFLAYEAAYVALPGIAVHLWLRPHAPWREQLVFGWALGYALEIGVYSLAAELDIRSAYPFYPLFGAALLGVLWRQRALSARTSPVPAAWGPPLAAAAVAVLTLVYLAIDYFARAHLPWRVAASSQLDDLSRYLSLSGEALHHWPIDDPAVAGEPKFYHFGVNVHHAAVADVTGLSLPLILFRLAVVPMTLLFLASMCVAARSLLRSAWVGPIAIALAMLVGDADVDPQRWPFFGLFFTGFWISPSFLLGIALFIPPVAIVAGRLAERPPLQADAGDWLVVAGLLAADIWSKATTVPLFTAGLLLYVLFRRERNAVAALALSAAIDLIFYAAFYRNSATGLVVHLPGAVGEMPRAIWLQLELADWGVPSWLGWSLITPIALLGMIGPALVGIPILVWLRWRSLGAVRVLFLALLAVGVGCAVVLFQPGESQLFFTHCGYAVGCLLSAEGLVLLFERRMRLGLAVFAAVWIGALAVASRAPLKLARWSVDHFGDDNLGPYRPRDVLFVLVFVAAVAVWCFGLRRRWPAWLLATIATVLLLGLTLAVTLREDLLYSFDMAAVAYGLLASMLILLAVLVAATRRRGFVEVFVVAALAVGAMGFPFDRVPGLAVASDRDAFPGDEELDRGLYDGLNWVRMHTPVDAVLAVDNYYRGSPDAGSPTFSDYSAFAERRVFLEGWYYTTHSWEVGASSPGGRGKIPFPGRFRLNEALFVRGDREALKTMVERYGVRYLLRDRRNGHAHAQLASLGRLVYENPSVAIYAVDQQ